jgi:hypothetical protein
VPWDADWQGAGRKVGEAVLETGAPSHAPGVFYRRVFILCDHDRSEPGPGPYDEGTAPFEGVDPSTVAPGQRGEQTERALAGA